MIHAVDSGAWLLALTAATAMRLSFIAGSIEWTALGGLVTVAALSHFGLTCLSRFHADRARTGSLDDAWSVVSVWVLVSPVVLLANFFVFGRPAPTLAVALGLPLALMIMLGARLGWRVIYDRFRRPDLRPNSKRVIVFGAGEGGEQIVRAMQRDPQSAYVPVAVLDDLKDKRSILGVPTLGTRIDMARVARLHRADVLLIAIPSADAGLVSTLDELGREAGLEVRVLPSTSELLGMLEIRDIRELTVADLLGREEVSVDLDAIRKYIEGRRILVTGAGGSIGSELCRQIHSLRPAELFMLDRDETALHGLQLSIEGKALLDTPNLIVADIRDRERMCEVFALHRFDVVFHTAALKHLTLLEQHPEEGVKTNVWGTSNVLSAALDHGVAEFVNVSTDKAADPTSVLGATKMLAERLTAIAARDSGLPYVSVRFGNVLGSRGSVLPTFREQIANGGPVTITDPDVTRYFMSIPEAVRLVLQAGAIGQPGEIMILDMGRPVRIADMALRLIAQSGKDIEIVYSGLRRGEKLHEVLVGAAEIGTTREHPRITHTAGSTSLEVDDEIRLDVPGSDAVARCARRMRLDDPAMIPG